MQVQCVLQLDDGIYQKSKRVKFSEQLLFRTPADDCFFQFLINYLLFVVRALSYIVLQNLRDHRDVKLGEMGFCSRDSQQIFTCLKSTVETLQKDIQIYSRDDVITMVSLFLTLKYFFCLSDVCWSCDSVLIEFLKEKNQNSSQTHPSSSVLLNSRILPDYLNY